jgi:hypothetical protein
MLIWVSDGDSKTEEIDDANEKEKFEVVSSMQLQIGPKSPIPPPAVLVLPPPSLVPCPCTPPSVPSLPI